MSDLHVVTVDQLDPRLGRQVVHDPRSRDFEYQPRTAAKPLMQQRWRHRVYGPRVTPNQPVGCCTGVDQAVKANTVGNRRRGEILDMDDALRFYSRATELDPWQGNWPPQDTGSSGLAACKAAAEAGVIERYEWVFSGPDAVLAALREHPVGVGAWWYYDMFNPEPGSLLVHPSGGRAGGHQWTLIGWEPKLRAFEGLCWWGPNFGAKGRFRIRYDDLAGLLADDGDCHVTYRRMT